VSDLIESVDCFAVDVPLPTTFLGSTYSVSSRCAIVTRIYCADGLVGQVYNGDPRDEAPAIVKTVMEDLAPLVKGRDPLLVSALWEDMYRLTHTTRDRKTLMAAISCLDSAIWDVRARRLGVSVAGLLGGTGEPVPVVAIAGYYGADGDAVNLGEEMLSLQNAGVAGCKMKVGGLSPAEDAERVQQAREGAGGDFVLAVDANRAWSVDEARDFASRIDELDIAWLEEPCHWHSDAEAMAAVARGTDMPICAGQSEITSFGVLRLLQSGGVDIVNFDASEGGGVTAWTKSAALAQAFNARVGHHEEPQVAAHLLSSISHSTFVECFPDEKRDPIWANMLVNGPSVQRGRMTLPEGSGFGLDFDEAFVARYRK